MRKITAAPRCGMEQNKKSGKSRKAAVQWRLVCSLHTHLIYIYLRIMLAFGEKSLNEWFSLCIWIIDYLGCCCYGWHIAHAQKNIIYDSHKFMCILLPEPYIVTL